MITIKELMVLFFIGIVILTPYQKAYSQEKITIDLQKKGADLSPSMFGVFFEEINHAGDGGLYAELVQNRSFEEDQLPEGFSFRGNVLVPKPVKNHLTGEVNKIDDKKLTWNIKPIRGWHIENSTPDAAKIKITKDRPFFETAPNNLEMTISDASKPVNLANEGYWGMGVDADGKYHLRVIIRVSAEYKGTVKACLFSEKGKLLASCPIELSQPGQWNNFHGLLASKEKDSKAHLSLVFDAPGKVWLDYVSLFPEATFKSRPNGLRKDIAQMIADIKPAFMRWPGGSIVGGITLDTRFKWKQTLGDPAARPGELFTWGYRCSYGLGYYEMLQYCEDIGADFMFVCSAGFGDQYRMGDACPEDQIDFYIKDCLDAIEYAIGATSTTWGARRAEDGHPKPFPLKYVEVGNEHWGKEYNHRFPIFYKAIKERYPQLSIIYNGIMPKNDTTEAIKADIVDPHFYETPQGFYRKNSQFDNHPRGKYKVYVGEYACNSGVGSGNMSAALSEAAFIAGMERNGDLVTMTSYAPLLENVNDRRWAVNLIQFNSDIVIGRSSYYVQKMASLNRPTYNVWSSFTQTKNENLPLQFLSAGYDKTAGELVLKFVNGSGTKYPAVIDLKGTTKVKKAGKIISLSAKSENDENTIDEPHKIYPQEIDFNGFGESFNYEFSPFSYTILRIKTK